MASSPSNDGVRSETITESVAESEPQEHAQPQNEDVPKLEPEDSNQGALDHEPRSKSPTQDLVLFRSQERQDSPVPAPVSPAADPDHGEVAVPIPQRPQTPSSLTVSREHSSDPRSDGSEQVSRAQSPTAELPHSQQPQPFDRDRYSRSSLPGSNTARTWDPSAGGLPSVDHQRRARAEGGFPADGVIAGQPVSAQHYPHGAFRTSPYHLPPMEDYPKPETSLPLPAIPGPDRAQENRSLNADSTGQPTVGGLLDYPRHNRWCLRPRHAWSGYLPDVYESRRGEGQSLDGRPLGLNQGCTRHLGPPLKPLDGAGSEEIAIEQWRLLVREREIRGTAEDWQFPLRNQP